MNFKHDQARINMVDLRGHYEIILVQAFDLLCLQRDRRITPAETHIGMMAFSFRKLAYLANEGERMSEILKPEISLNAPCLVVQPPIRSLREKTFRLPARERIYAPATRRAGPGCQGVGHVPCSPLAASAPAADASSVTPPANTATVMTDDGTAMMNDDDRWFDGRLDRFRKHRARRDRRRLRDAGQHAESQRGGDNAVLDAFQHPELIFKRHCILPFLRRSGA
jgi:hypothetical protein